MTSTGVGEVDLVDVDDVKDMGREIVGLGGSAVLETGLVSLGVVELFKMGVAS